ncbi:septum formation inhibitor Maf [bacterium BFN5]|nr:septum formation inhibitor Maf [bacterium BFN5]QJW45326.1 septum formation inhibitor Maf [bacterium BFN5]
MSIILASASPRRKELLEQIGCQFSIMTSDITEDNTLAILPHKLAVQHAQSKAVDVASKLADDDIVIGADTVVVLDGKVFGKPADAVQAKQMLTCLAGRSHHVITGIAVVRGKEVWTDFTQTQVDFISLTNDEIDRYIATGEPMDKAGAYAIQGIGALFVDHIHGCYTNVVGLPLNNLARLLKKAGIRLL